MWPILIFCFKGDGPRPNFKFQPLNAANAICDRFEEVFTLPDVCDKIVRDSWRIQWRIQLEDTVEDLL